MKVVPRGDPAGDVRYYQAPAERLRLSPTGTMPVFVMRHDQSAIRNGVARVEPAGIVRVEFYQERSPEMATATEALLFQPGFAALWAAASDASQKELLQRAQAVQGQVGQTLERVIGSDAFNREYRPILRAILTDAVTAAWDDARSKVAFDFAARDRRPDAARHAAGRGRQDPRGAARARLLAIPQDQLGEPDLRHHRR